MNYLTWVNLALYFIFGAVLAAAGVGIFENTLMFIVLMLLVIVIENVGRTDEIMKRYRG